MILVSSDNSSWNQSLADSRYAQYEFGNNDFNGSGNFTGDNFFGRYNWTSANNWNDFDGSILTFNDSKLASIYYNLTQSQIVAGTVDGGTLEDTQHPDGAYDDITFNFSEASGSPGLDLRINFTNIEEFNRGVMRYKTSSLAGDFPIIQLWDYDDSVWEDYPSVSEILSFATITQPVFDDSEHIGDKVVQMRIYKSGNGNTNNHYYIDWIAIVKGFGTPSGQEVDPFWEEDKSNYLTSNETNLSYLNISGENARVNLDIGIYNLTASWFKGLFNIFTKDTWLSFNGSTMVFNESKLNDTIETEGILLGFNSTYNATYDANVGNSSWNQSMAYDEYLNRSSEDIYLSTYNESYDTYDYNQTTPAETYADSLVRNLC